MTEQTGPTFEITMEEEPNITSQEVVHRPRSPERENSDKNLRSEISSRHNFTPTTADGYLEGADDSSTIPSPQKNGRRNQFLDSDDNTDEDQLQVPDESSSSEAGEPEAQGDRDVSASSSSVEEMEAVNYFPDNNMQVDRGFVTSHRPIGIKYKAQDKVEEVYNPKTRKINRDLRRATKAEREIWNRERLCIWKTEMEEKIIY
jgi:hypothetical protein